MVLDMLPVETNIIIFTLSDGITAEKFVQLLGRQNILVSATGKQTVRMVTHLDFTDPMLEIVEKAIKSI